LANTTSGWSEEEIGKYVDHIYDDLAQLRDVSPQLMRHAQCMIVFGTFENCVVDLCKAAHDDGKIPDPLPKGNMGMQDVDKYLRPQIRQRPAPFSKDWQWVDEFRVIRNWMAHNGGKVPDDDRSNDPNSRWTKASSFLRRNKGLVEFRPSGAIIVKDGLVDHAIQRTRNAHDRLRLALKALYR